MIDGLVVRLVRAKYLSQVVVGIKRRANIADTPRKKTLHIYQAQTRHRSIYLPACLSAYLSICLLVYLPRHHPSQ